MKILFLVPYPSEGASNRYRIEQYLPVLEKEGIEYSLRPFWHKAAFKILYKKGNFLNKTFFFSLGTIFRLRDILTFYRYDIIFIHREIYPIFGPLFETIIHIFNKPFIFDFDDSIYLSSRSKQNKFIEFFKKPGKIPKIIKMSSFVIAGNNFLADYASRFNRNVAVIPTAIDTAKYYPEPKNPEKEIVVGWIGSVTTVDFIKPLTKLFDKLSVRYRNIVFKVIGGDPVIDRRFSIVTKAWLQDEELADLRSFDIGLMPMPDNEWTQGKCGFKAILYMSMGIPCVCSPVGVNKEIIKDGVNGFLANTEEEWLNKLSLLIESRELRTKIGLEGRKTVEEKYSLKVNAPKLLEVIRKVASR